jgi:hypothetical protein
MPSDIIILSERIKELSHDTGTGSLTLDGAATGFSAFGDYYSNNDAVYYAITDGTHWETGSGQYVSGGSNSITRTALKSTNSNSLVNFTAGIKEVYVTYPGQFSVFSADGLGSFSQPQASGLAFWGSSNIVDYDSDLIWDKTNSRMGVGQSSPQYAIHVGSQESYSQIYSSGSIVGDSGVLFAGVNPAYSGGRQLEPFVRNQILDTATGVLALSGHVSQHIYLKKAQAGTVLSGPPSGCTPSSTCPENYPAFRALVADDIPDLYSVYVTPVSGWASGTFLSSVSPDFTYVSGVANWASGNTASSLSSASPEFVYVSGVANWASGNSVYNWDISDQAGVSGTIADESTVYVSGISGVTTSYNATNRVMTISAASLSGWASGTFLSSVSPDFTYVSGVANWASGNANSAAVSGWASGTFLSSVSPDFTYVSGVAAWASGASLYNWNISDGISAYDTIVGADTVYISGISGVATSYNSTTNIMQINAAEAISVASGFARAYTDATLVDSSGFTHWTINDGAGHSENIGHASGISVSGISGIDTFYNTTTNVLEVNAASLSGWASGTFLSSVSPDFTYVSGVANWASGNVKRSTAGDTDNGIVTWVTSDDTFAVESNITFDGSALQLDGTLTVGVDGTGKDVKFYGDTTGSYLEWDQSEDRLNLVSGVFVNEAVPADDTPTTAMDGPSGIIALDLSLGNYHNFAIGTVPVSGISFNNAKRGQKFVLRLTQHDTTAQTVTAWNNTGTDYVYYTGTTKAELRWAGNITPTMCTSTGHTDVFGFLCTDSLGSKFDAFIVGQDLPD